MALKSVESKLSFKSPLGEIITGSKIYPSSFPVSFDISFYKKFLSEVYQEDLTIYKTIRSGGAVSLMHQIKRQYLAIATTVRNETVTPQDDGDFTGYTLRSISFLLAQNKVDHFQYPTFGHRIAFICNPYYLHIVIRGPYITAKCANAYPCAYNGSFFV